METINNIELNDESIFPDNEVLKPILGESYNSYLELLTYFENNNLKYEWRYYKDGGAWLCKVQYKRETVVWMSAWKDFMQATVYIPLRLLNDVYNLNLFSKSKEKIKETKNVGKSKPCIIEIRSAESIIELDRLINFKINS